MKTLLAMIALTISFFLPNSGLLHAQTLRNGEIFREDTAFLPAHLPDKSHLSPPSFTRLTVRGKVVGTVVLYDDPKTRRSADHLEIYNTTGQLVAVSWFDRFGIRRTAVDRGLLEGTLDLEGVFFLLPDGEPS